MTFHVPETRFSFLAGKIGLVVGIADERSIAYGCARAFRDAGAELAVTYLDDKAKPHVEPVARELEAGLLLRLDVRDAARTEAVLAAARERWGRLDFLVHSIAFAPKADLQGRLVDSSAEGFLAAMDISCRSFVRMMRLAEPLMGGGGALVTTSYYGAEKVVPGYGLTGPVKARSRPRSATWPTSSGPRESGSTPSRPARSRRGPPRGWPASTSSWPRPGSARPSASWSTSWTSAPPPRSCARPTPS
jgi:enoyl-[acyl-carrier protein] reductase I